MGVEDVLRVENYDMLLGMDVEIEIWWGRAVEDLGL